MDILSLIIGFIGGTATGAAGNYLADKFTDVRRDKKSVKNQEKIWRDLERRFPVIISEMRVDFSTPTGKNVRAFFIKESDTIMGFLSEPCFEYHTDKHPDLRAAVLYLLQNDFISDITPGSTPMYRVHEKLVDALLKPQN